MWQILNYSVKWGQIKTIFTIFNRNNVKVIQILEKYCILNGGATNDDYIEVIKNLV